MTGSIRTLFALVACTMILFGASHAFAQANLSIDLGVSPTSETDSNGRITYTAVVTNSGATAANNLVVTFTLSYYDLPITSTPTNCVFTYNGPLYATCPLGSVAANGGTATAIAVIYPTNVGNLIVDANATESGGATAAAEVGSTITGVGIADVLVQLTATPNPAYAGQTLTYGLTAYNIGDDDAQGVTVSLILPPTVSVGAMPAGCTRANSTINCSIGHMVVTGQKTFNINVVPTKSGWIFATALLRGETVADPSTLNNSSASRIWVNPAQ